MTCLSCPSAGIQSCLILKDPQCFIFRLLVVVVFVQDLPSGGEMLQQHGLASDAVNPEPAG